MEYLTLLSQVKGEPRWAVGESVREALRLSGERKGSGFTGGEDAGVDPLRPAEAAGRVGAAGAGGRGAVRGGPAGEAAADRSADAAARPGPTVARLRLRRRGSRRAVDRRRRRAAETGPIKVLQGRDAVRDALIDPKQPDRKLAREAALQRRRARATRAGRSWCDFDLDKLDLPKSARWRRRR